MGHSLRRLNSVVARMKRREIRRLGVAFGTTRVLVRSHMYDKVARHVRGHPELRKSYEEEARVVAEGEVSLPSHLFRWL